MENGAAMNDIFSRRGASGETTLAGWIVIEYTPAPKANKPESE